MTRIRGISLVTPKEAFDAAVQLGVLSLDDNAPNWVANYMYMYTDAREGHAFTHIMTREYVFTFECDRVDEPGFREEGKTPLREALEILAEATKGECDPRMLKSRHYQALRVQLFVLVQGHKPPLASAATAEALAVLFERVTAADRGIVSFPAWARGEIEGSI